MDRYETERILARGTFGTVYLCHLKSESSKQVVIKQLSMEVFNGTERISTLNETKVLSMLDHPNIIKYHDSFLNSDASSMYMVMEYAPGGTLFDFIEHRRKLMLSAMTDKNVDPGSYYFQGCQIFLSIYFYYSN